MENTPKYRVIKIKTSQGPRPVRWHMAHTPF